MRSKSKIVVLVSCLFVVCFAEDELKRLSSGFSAQVSYEKINYILTEYELQDVTINGQTFKKPIIPFGGLNVEEGDPVLPTVTTFYQVEPNKSYSIEVNIQSSEIFENIDIAPHQTWDPVTDEITLPFKRNIGLYTSDEPYPKKQASISQTIVFRDLPVVKVVFTPFSYHPLSRQLEIITSADIDLVETGNIEPVQIPSRRSRVFEPLYESIVVNYSRSVNDEDYQKPSILYILPNNSSNLMSNLEILFDWRHQSGYVVNYASTSTIGTSTSAIKNYISNTYGTWANPPEYVALVGDVGGNYSIPTYFLNSGTYNGEGDHPYSQLVGNDILPEVILGRLSFSTTTELATIINKTVQYETNPYVSENWFHSAAMVGDPSSSGISTIITCENIKEMMEYQGYDNVRTIYNSPFPSQMVSDLNAGLTFFNYRGYWGVSGFGNDDISILTNGFKLPVATIITCGSGSFASGTTPCISEALVTAGTPTQPKGAVASIGTATLGTHTMFNNVVDMGFYYGIFVDGLETVGAALVRGKLNLYLNYPGNPNNYVDIFTHWNNLMGDPALRMWTDIPKSFTVSHENIVAAGSNFIDVTVMDYFNMPVEKAYVTILKGDDEIFESAFTDVYGNVSLPISTTSTGDVDITVVKRNYIPYQVQFQIIDQAVNVNAIEGGYTIDDDSEGNSIGNANGIVNGGETIELTIPVYNYGTDEAQGVYCKLTSDGDLVTFITDSLYIGPLTSGMTANIDRPFVFEVQVSAMENDNLDLRLFVEDINGTSWWSEIKVFSAGSLLKANAVIVRDDPVYGNGILDPGETAELEIKLLNDGSVTVNNLTGMLSSNLSGIDILDDLGYWPMILAGNISTNNTDRFEVSAAEDVIPGTRAELLINLEAASGLSTSLNIPFQIGIKDVNDPLGPDAYGYYAYDSGDILYSNAPYFSWIEIDDQYGGSGTQLFLNDNGDNQDDVTTVNLPFSFKFYGIDYDQISVCSNGWISMGNTSMQSFRNYHLPGPGGPSPMIAVFWDDLTTINNGRVYKWYDEENNQFIIEWSRVRTYDNNSLETFQVILRDAQHYFTPTGDGEILIQFADFNNTSTGNFSWGQVHGSYCTVGLEDHTENVGLEYTFNNDYPVAAMPLQDSTAILFTTRGSNIRQRGDITQDGLLNIFDVLTLVDFVQANNTGSLNPYLADINADQTINFLDMISIVQEIMGF